MNEFKEFVGDLTSRKMHDVVPNVLLHSSMGLSEEGGEILGLVKKSVWYGKEMNYALLIEEMGDALHYLQMMCNGIGVTFEDLINTNTAKLRLRYPEGFTTDKAIVRDKEAENKVFTDFIKEKHGTSTSV